MEIYDLKTNGKTDPMGEDFPHPTLSWKINGEEQKKIANVRLEVSTDRSFASLCYQEEGAVLSGIAHPIQLALAPRQRYHWRVRLFLNPQEVVESQPAFFETGKLDEPWSGQWIAPCEGDTFHPEFQHRFQAKKGWCSAKLYITGLGLFEAYLNGEKVGCDHLAPFLNDYREGVQACTYDVSALLQEENQLSVLLGDGWYKGRYGLEGKKEIFGDRYLLKAELHISYPDGTEDVIASSPAWEYRRSFVTSSGIYDGEHQDHDNWRKWKDGWKHAEAAEGPLTLGRYSLPLKAQEVLEVKEVIHTPSGETILDFGQNFAGYVEYSGAMVEGQCLRLLFGEILQEGCFYQENYRTAKAEFCYRSDGVKRTVRPHFTYYGFRYVKVETSGTVRPEDFKGIALYSDVERTGSFSSSDERLGRLYLNTVWGLKSNFLDMPTDCPQRDERLGWTGDAQVFAPTASYHVDTKAFFSKYLTDLRKDQLRNGGKVAIYLPNFHPGMTSGVWSDVATILPMVLYRYFGDRELLRENYPLMKDWVECIHAQDCARGQKNLWDFGFQFGDWLALDGVTPKSMIGATEPYFIASAYYHRSARLTSEAAAILGYEKDAHRYGQLAEKIKEQILYHYFTPSGRLSIDTQTAYYVSLAFGLYRTKDMVVSGLRRRLKKDCYQIKSGFTGVPLMCGALAEAGLFDIACDYLFQEEFPGWFYEVAQGATTIWERWNSVLPDGRISDTGMNSLNHYAYGSIAEFLYRYIGGIQPESPGFQEARIAPHFTSHLRWADCSYLSAAGLYHVRWELRKDREAEVSITVPFGAKARIFLPEYEHNGEELEAGTYLFRYRTKKDYTCRYQMPSRLKQMKEDEDVLKIAEDCSAFRDLLLHGDEEALSQSLEDLEHNAFSGIEGKALQDIVGQILSLKTYSSR